MLQEAIDTMLPMIAERKMEKGRVPKKRREAVATILRWTLDSWIKSVDSGLKAGVVRNIEEHPAIMRIENTMFTTGRYYGGMNYNGQHYTYVEPEIDGHAPNVDGTPYVAWVMVRDDFLEWIIDEVSEERL